MLCNCVSGLLHKLLPCPETNQNIRNALIISLLDIVLQLF